MSSITQLNVNGTVRQTQADPGRSLLSVLRDDLDLTGCKYGCGEGRCGACTVLLDGQPVHACITRVDRAAGKAITTVESLEQNGRLHALQQAFLDAGALQCGYCTSGMIMSALALLRQTPRPSRAEIIRFMNGNICRCGVYSRIVLAIENAARMLEGHAP